MNKKWIAFLAAIGSTSIYALNHIIAKDVLLTVSPLNMVLLRVGGAAILFWIGSLFVPNKKLENKDLKTLILCAIMATTNMFFFLYGLQFTTPINSSLIIITIPVITIIISVIFLKEKITWKKSSGVIIAMIGTASLIWFGKHSQINAQNIPLGNLFIFGNATFFAVYLILVKSLLEKYHVFILMRWMFLIGFIIYLPFGLKEFTEMPWHEVFPEMIPEILFVVVGTTFLTYALNMFALRYIKASTLSVFTYLQPLVAIVVSSLLGIDKMSGYRYIAMILIFLGVWLVIDKRRRPQRAFRYFKK